MVGAYSEVRAVAPFNCSRTHKFPRTSPWLQEEYNRRLAEWHAENRRRQEANEAERVALLREAEARAQQQSADGW